jgi:hypothetical protein
MLLRKQNLKKYPKPIVLSLIPLKRNSTIWGDQIHFLEDTDRPELAPDLEDHTLDDEPILEDLRIFFLSFLAEEMEDLSLI